MLLLEFKYGFDNEEIKIDPYSPGIFKDTHSNNLNKHHRKPQEPINRQTERSRILVHASEKNFLLRCRATQKKSKNMIQWLDLMIKNACR